MTNVIAFVTAHGADLLAIWGALVALASLVVKLTPSTKDDEILGKIIKAVEYLSIFNKK